MKGNAPFKLHMVVFLLMWVSPKEQSLQGEHEKPLQVSGSTPRKTPALWGRRTWVLKVAGPGAASPVQRNVSGGSSAPAPQSQKWVFYHFIIGHGTQNLPLGPEETAA